MTKKISRCLISVSDKTDLDKLVADGVLSHETTTDAHQEIDVYQVIGDEYNED